MLSVPGNSFQGFVDAGEKFCSGRQLCIGFFMILSFVCETKATHLDEKVNDTLTKPERE